MQNFGYAALQIIPSMRGAKSAMESELNGVAGATGSKAGSSFASNFGTALKSLGKAAGATLGVIATTVAGIAVAGGISRALAIENAQAKLTGLGHDAASVAQIMDNALASVKGTAFGLGDAASVAAGLVASGVAQGAQLEGVLKTVADTATISGRSLVDVGTIFGSVAARGKLQGDDMLQLMSSGVPVLQLLADHLGTTSAAVSEMVTKGKIDFGTFAAAMDAGMGGAALASGNTFTGALANVRAALGRLGAAVVTPALGSLKSIFADAIPAIDNVTAGLEPLITALADRLAPMVENLSSRFFEMLSGIDFSRISSGLQSVSGMLGPLAGLAAGSLGPLLSGLPVVGGLFNGITGPIGLVLGLIGQMLASSPALRDALGSTFQSLADILVALSPLLVTAAGAVAAISSEVATALASALETVNPMLDSFAGFLSDNIGAVTAVVTGIGAGVIAFKAWNGAVALWTGITRTATAVQVAFNAVMNANPVMLVVTAIAALVAGLVYFFTQTETGAKLWDTIWSGIKSTVENVVNWFSNAWSTVVGAWENVSSFFSGLWDSITSGGTALSGWFSTTFGPGISAAWTGIQDAVSAVTDWFGEHVGPVFQAFGELLAAVWERVTQAASLWWTFLQTVFQLVIEGWQWVWDGVTSIWDAVGAPVLGFIQTLFGVWLDVLQSIWNVAAAAWSVLWEGIKVAWDTIGAVLLVTIQAAWEHIKIVLSGIWNGMKAVLTGVWNGMKIAVETVLGVIKGIIQTVTAVIKGDWSGAWNAIVSVFTTAWDGMKRGVQNAIDTIGSIIRTIKDTVLGVFSNAGSWLLDAGKKIIEGLIDGIGNMFGSVKDKLSSLTDLLPSWKGPPGRDARILRGAGQLVISGFVDGLDDGFGSVRSALGGVTDLIEGYDLPTLTVGVELDDRMDPAALAPTVRAPYVPAPTYPDVPGTADADTGRGGISIGTLNTGADPAEIFEEAEWRERTAAL